MSTELWSHLLATATTELALSFVDVETTGLSAWSGDRICEVAVVHCRGRCEVERFVSLVNPGRSISPGAAAVNGITAAMVRDAPRFADVARDVARLLNAGVTVAHNAGFDLSFLSQELAAAGIPLPAVPVIDTLALARRCFSFPSNNLGRVAAALGIAGGGHRALSDALTARGVLERFVQLLEAQGQRLTLGDLLALQGSVAGWLAPASIGAASLPPELAALIRVGGRVRLRYVSADGAVTERIVEPLDVAVRRGEAYLVGYCHLRQEQRTFRVARILHWEPG